MNYLKAILETIYSYFPKYLSYDDPRYFASTQHMTLIEKKKQCQNDDLRTLQLSESLQKIFEGYEIINWTDLESYHDYEYRILLHQNQSILDDDLELLRSLNGKRLDLFLFISILDDYYFFFLNETVLENGSNEKYKFSYVTEPSEEIKILIEKMRTFFSELEYREITDQLANTIVQHVETELKADGKATVFHCLFNDLISIPGADSGFK